MCQQLWKTQQWPQDWKRSVFIPIPKKDNVKKCSNYHTTTLITYASEVMLTILQASLQEYLNQEFPDVQAGFKQGRETRDQNANIHWNTGKEREFQKNIYFSFTDYPENFDHVGHNKLKNSSRDRNTKPPYLPPDNVYWRRQWHPTSVLLPGKSHGWRSLVGCSSWGR